MIFIECVRKDVRHGLLTSCSHLLAFGQRMVVRLFQTQCVFPKYTVGPEESGGKDRIWYKPGQRVK
jgi:hypothetical protein